MQQRSAPPSRRRGPVCVEQAEAALVDHYPRLVRIAYLTLPAAQGKHRRLLAAHAVVQRSLPRGQNESGRAPATPAPPSGRGAAAAPGSRAEAAYALVRQETLRGALAHGDGAGRWNRVRRSAQRAAWPWVWGLRLYPKAGGTDEFAVDRALSGLGAAAQAAAALRGLEGLDDRAVREVLGAAGVTNPRAALAQASAAGAPSALHAAGDFDPCTVQARPTDLLRRRQPARTAAVSTMAAATAAAVLALSVPGDTGPEPYAAAGPPADRTAFRAPASLVRADAWADTSQLDFSVWPARGDRKRDTELLLAALTVWAHPGPRVQVSSTPGTVRTPPAQPPQLLYAGDLDAATVVLFFDGLRIVRYARPHDDGADAALDFARVDGVDHTTAAAVVLVRTDTNARFLTAPWVVGRRPVTCCDRTGPRCRCDGTRTG